ncbi:unnamed protein product [Amaranthus hypochondriacus]
METISISELLRRRRPISGAFSVAHSLPSRTSPPLSAESKTLNPNSLHRKILDSYSQPSIIVGILSLPVNSHSPSSDVRELCLSFSDTSGSVLCDVIDFDIRMINTKINVLAWNFIPIKQSTGLLEIIKWEFYQTLGFSNGNVTSFPLVFQNSDIQEDTLKKAKYSVYGLLLSVSPVSSVPCSNIAVTNNDCAFILEILCCDCNLCTNLVRISDDVVIGTNAHSFCSANYVYFCGIFLVWYPLFSKLIGNVILLSRMRKKLVYIAKEEAQLMFIPTQLSCLNVPNSQPKEGCLLQNCNPKIEGKGELGMYIGVVRGIHMQGMVVQLDQEVWLLLTGQSISLPISARVGSIISMKNVHVLNSKFCWGTMLILGACCKSNIRTVSFSPLETGCQLQLRSESLLGKFIDSLIFPARFWVLLLVQCLRKKFSGVFSEKEILGTNKTEGLVQTYAMYALSSSVLRSQSDTFLEFCKHNSCGSGNNNYYDSLSLTMPFSYLVHHCESICLKSLLQMNNGLKILEGCNQVGYLSQENRLSNQLIRRILPSKDIGVSLLGNLKICPATGRLQYVDATGNIDAVIPDIPSTWDSDAIYEVLNYSLVLEGVPEVWGQIHNSDLFSCSSLFETLTIRQTNLTVYVHFSWSNVCCRHFGAHLCQSSINSLKVDSGTFHLLCLAHKFRPQAKFHDSLLVSGKTHSFAEFIVLPWDLNISKNDGTNLLPKRARDLENGCQNKFPLKRCKTDQTLNCFDKVGLCDTFKKSEMTYCEQPSEYIPLPHKTRSLISSGLTPVQLRCTLIGKEVHGQSMALPAILCYTGDCEILYTRKLLLEFNSENFFKYKLLQIGGYYIMKHCSDKCFCDSQRKNLGSSMSVTSGTKFWSLSFHFSEVIDCSSGTCNDRPSASCSITENLKGFYRHNELVLNPGTSADFRTFNDVDLYVEAVATGLQDVHMSFHPLNMPVLNLSLSSTAFHSIGQPAGPGNTVMDFSEKQGMHCGCGLSEGNLISVQGTVVSLHHPNICSIDRITCNGASHNFHLPRSCNEKEGSIYLLMLTDGLLVRVCGHLSKLDYPIGFGPGAVATFHRILACSGQNCLILTPVTFITINSVREIPSPTVKSLCPIQEETVISCLISNLTNEDMGRPRRLRCSIVAVYFVILERNKDFDKLLSRNDSGTPVVDIPLAGFILDDGSSHCCCWTNGERAAMLLKLHKEIPQTESGSRWQRPKDAVSGRAFITPSHQLNRILKKHGRVSVKNYGSIHETLCQDLHLSVGSDCTFSSQDDSALKFTMLNACSGTFWNVIGHAMDIDAVNMLEKILHEEQMPMHALQNIWAKEVFQLNPLAQAKALLQEL